MSSMGAFLAALWGAVAFAQAEPPRPEPARIGIIDVAGLLFPPGSATPGGASAPLVEAAASVTEALRARARGARKGGESCVGREVRLRLRSGAMSGTVRAAADDGLVVDSAYVVDGQRLQRTARVSWDALTTDQVDELARQGGWEAAPDDRAVVRACAALASGDLDAAEQALGQAAGHVLHGRLLARVQQTRAEAAYGAAMERARQCLRAKDWAGAAGAVAEALRHRAGDAPAAALRAEARYSEAMERAASHVRRREWKPAVEAAGEALAARPGDPAAAKLQAEATAALDSSTRLVLDLAPRVSLDLVFVKPGVFLMGGKGDPEVSWEGVRKPQHEVEISRGFCLGRCEVTRGQFAAFVKETGHVTEAEKKGSAVGRRPDGSFGELPGSSWRDTIIYPQMDDHPVTVVNWFDCTAFCAWASKKTGREVRLPTEAEWEFACRAGTATYYHPGNDEKDLQAQAWYSGNANWRTHPVGQKRPNAWGLYDMHGNVYEWVADGYVENYYARSPRRDPPGPAGGNRGIARGGGWHGGAACCGSEVRRLEGRNYGEPDLGFRVAVTAR